MTVVQPLTDLPSTDSDVSPGRGCLTSEQGRLPLRAFTARVGVVGRHASVTIRQTFLNPTSDLIEATYIHPLPDRAAVVAFTATLGGRRIEGLLRERGEARATYDQAVADGHRAAITEEERPDVFTTRVGNLAPGERAEIELTLVQPLPWDDGRVSYRLPLVVAPRYIPGDPLDGPSVGDGTVPDTDAVPDASRITPPVLVPGARNPVDLDVEIDFGETVPPGLASSLHAVVETGGVVSLRPGERLDRDLVLRWDGPAPVDGPALTGSLVTTTDAARSGDVPGSDGVDGDGTFTFQLLPPTAPGRPRPRDVVVVLDRSGSMHGWKMVAARRAAARIIDTLGSADRFAVLAFDHSVERPPRLGSGLVVASDRNRWLAIEWLAGVDAAGGTELRQPLADAVALLTEPVGDGTATGGAQTDDGAAGRGDRRRATCLVITDGQVGNEDQILAELGSGLGAARVFTVGIDRAVNAGFLQRLAAVGGGRCELVESEDRLDEVLAAVHGRIADVALESVTVGATSGQILDLTPSGRLDCFSGVPLEIRGRYRGLPPTLSWTAVDPDAEPGQETLSGTVEPVAVDDGAAFPLWARARIRDLEDAYTTSTAGGEGSDDAADRIVALSLASGVLCRFTAFVAVDTSATVVGGTPVGIVQPVETPAGWNTGLVFGAAPIGAAPVPAAPMMTGAPPQYAMPAPIAPPKPTESARAVPGAPGGPAPGNRPGSAPRNRRSGGSLARKQAQVPPAGPVSAWSALPPSVSSAPDLDRYLDRLEELIGRIDGGETGPRLRRELDDLATDLASIGAADAAVAAVRRISADLAAGRSPARAVTEAREALTATGAGATPPPAGETAAPSTRRRFWR